MGLRWSGANGQDKGSGLVAMGEGNHHGPGLRGDDGGGLCGIEANGPGGAIGVVKGATGG